MKIPPKLRDFFNRASKLPNANVESITARIHAALDRAGLRSEGVVPPQAGAPTPEFSAASRSSPDTGNTAFVTRTYSCASGSRDYKLFVPSTYSARLASRPPLLVMLHGCQQSADDTAAGTRMNVLGERHGFLVVYPQQTARSNGSKCWNWFRPDDQARGRGEPAIIAGITAEVTAEFNVDTKRVFIAGLSAGGAMSVIMAVNYPDVYAGVGVHSGLPFGVAHDVASAFSAMRNGDQTPHSKAGLSRTVPTIVFHGDSDQTVSLHNAEAIIEQVLATQGGEPSILRRSAGEINGRHYTRHIYSDETHRDFLETWILKGAGHAWSGGSSAGTFTDESGPDASAEMVRFFLSL